MASNDEAEREEKGMGKLWGAAVSRRQLVGLGASLLTAALAGCTPGESKEPSGISVEQVSGIPATADNVRLIGRTYEEGGVTWLPQSGSAVEFETVGTSIRIEIAGDESVRKKPGLRPRFAVVVDDEIVMDNTLDVPSCIVEAPLSDSGKRAVVQVIHLSEAKLGMVGVRSIAASDDEPAQVTPTAAKDLSIGFVGDSITCGYGVESSGKDDPFRTTTENFMKSYAYLVAKELNADYDTACYSGYGVVSGWSADGERVGSMLVPPLYDLVTEGHEYKWDFAEHPRDVVVVSLGTNDATYTKTDEARIEEFTRGYTEFIGQVREYNPDALIVCTLGAMTDCEMLYAPMEQAVRDHADQTGDTRIVSHLSNSADIAANGVGTGEHPNEEGQRKIAQELVGIIRSELQMA